MPAQLQKQFYSKDNPSQMVVQTPLGWALMGSKQCQNSTSRETPKERKTDALYSEGRGRRRRRMRFKYKSGRAQWLLIDKQAMCPLCLSGAHAVINCPQLEVTTRRCKECNYTHSREIKCRHADDILQARRNPQKRRENTKVTPGNMPSRESDVPTLPTEQTEKVKVVPEAITPVPESEDSNSKESHAVHTDSQKA